MSMTIAHNANETKTRPLGTWVSETECALFLAICARHNVKPAAMLRALVVDCIAEESDKITTPIVIKRKVVPDLFLIA